MFGYGPLGMPNPRRAECLWLPGTRPQSTTNGFVPFTIPRNASMLFAFCMGSGSGGGAGAIPVSSGVAAIGGGGGGSGAMSRLLIPTEFLPSTLYLLAAVGGAGGVHGVSSGNASAGQSSYISDGNTVTGSDLILISGTTPATATPGAPNGGSGSSTAGVGETIATATNAKHIALGVWTAVAGQNGSVGTASAAGTNVSLTGNVTTGGSGGGGADTTTGKFAGGNITGNSASIPTINGGVAGGGAGNMGFGQGGMLMGGGRLAVEIARQVFAFTGGTGGGGNSGATTGGKGGAGSWGGGGGGGGGVGGTNGQLGTAGDGGPGGPGFIFLLWW